MPECYADTLMIETFVPPKLKYNHKHSCFQVEKEMVKGKFKDKFAVAIIDKDKKQIKYLNEFDEIDKVEGSLLLLRHKSREKHHFIIQILPALEQWVMNVCKEENIIPEDVPTDIKELRKYTKKQSSIRNKDLKNLFVKMGERNENVNIRKLKRWLILLKEKNYEVDLNELKNA